MMIRSMGGLPPIYRRLFPAFRWPTLPAFLLLLLTATNAARAQDDRSLTAPIAWWWYDGASPEFISQVISENGARITDIEVETSPFRFTVVLVKNEGPYKQRWWWYYDLAGPRVDRSLAEERARIVDIELVAVRPDARFAVVLVENGGEQAKVSNWTAGSVDAADDGAYLANLSQSGMRLIDFDPNDQLGGYTTSVEIANEGNDAVAWWWYPDVPPDVITAKLQDNNARLVDIEWKPAGRFSALMVASRGEAWWWYYDLTAEDVNNYAQQNGARVIDIETRWVNGQKRFATIMLQSRAQVEAPAVTRAPVAAAPPPSALGGDAIRRLVPQAVRESDAGTAAGFLCVIERTAGETPALRVTLTTENECAGQLVADVLFVGDGQFGYFSELAGKERELTELKAEGSPISIDYTVLPDGTHRALEYSY